MLEYIVALVAVFIVCSWLLRSLKIPHRYNDLYVLITGCDSGFGRETVYRLDKLGFHIFAGCLTENGVIGVQQSSSVRVYATQVDITKSEQIDNWLSVVKSHLPANKGLWGIVNNAGIGGYLGPSDLLTKDEYHKVMEVNLYGMVEIVHHFLPLVRMSSGRIVNTTSINGRIGYVLNPYCASKFAAEGFSDCLRRELYHQGVSVHIIEPGTYNTGIADRTYETSRKHFEKLFLFSCKEVKDYYGPDFVRKTTEEFKLEVFKQTASNKTYKVVDAYIDALTARFPKTRYVVGSDARILLLISMFPEWITDFVLSKLLPKFPIPNR